MSVDNLHEKQRNILFSQGDDRINLFSHYFLMDRIIVESEAVLDVISFPIVTNNKRPLSFSIFVSSKKNKVKMSKEKWTHKTNHSDMETVRFWQTVNLLFDEKHIGIRALLQVTATKRFIAGLYLKLWFIYSADKSLGLFLFIVNRFCDFSKANNSR